MLTSTILRSEQWSSSNLQYLSLDEKFVSCHQILFSTIQKCISMKVRKKEAKMTPSFFGLNTNSVVCIPYTREMTTLFNRPPSKKINYWNIIPPNKRNPVHFIVLYWSDFQNNNSRLNLIIFKKTLTKSDKKDLDFDSRAYMYNKMFSKNSYRSL